MKKAVALIVFFFYQKNNINLNLVVNFITSYKKALFIVKLLK